MRCASHRLDFAQHPLSRGDGHGVLWRMTDSFDAMSIGIENKGSIVIGVIAGPKTGCTLVASSGGKRRRVQGIDRSTVWSTEAHMRSGNRWRPSYFPGNDQASPDQAPPSPLTRPPSLTTL